MQKIKKKLKNKIKINGKKVYIRIWKVSEFIIESIR